MEDIPEWRCRRQEDRRVCGVEQQVRVASDGSGVSGGNKSDEHELTLTLAFTLTLALAFTLTLAAL